MPETLPDIRELQARIVAIEQRLPPKRVRHPRAAMDGDTLARLRRAAGLSQRDLAAFLGVSGPAVHQMEHGEIPVDDVRARKVRKVVIRVLRKIDDHSRTPEQTAILAECEKT